MSLIDITHTIDPKVTAGRKLFRDLATGAAVWEERRAVPRDENTVWPLTQPKEVIAAEKDPEPEPEPEEVIAAEKAPEPEPVKKGKK